MCLDLPMDFSLKCGPFTPPGLQNRSLTPAVACCQLIVANPPDRIVCLQRSGVNTVFSGNTAEHFLRNVTDGRRHD
jgi:hypothetical protein